MKELFKSSTINDHRKLFALTIANVLYCVCYTYIALFIFFTLDESLTPYISDPERGIIASVVGQCLVPLVLTILAGILIDKLRVWLLSLPLQYLLYFGISYLVYVNFGGLSVAACAGFAGQLLLIQIPGVAIGFLVRYLIRKVKSRKQPALVV